MEYIKTVGNEISLGYYTFSKTQFVHRMAKRMTIPYEMESAPFSNIFGTLLNEKFYVVR
jgi:hypothetical protein